MPKHDAFSPKAIANRQKLKGLQRLRWYCQMCQKQCRDENGFKCHSMSEGHLRQMRIFAQNPNQLLDQFSREFEKGFLQILSHSHGTKRVSANRVYQEYIADKNHVHMNATAWTTLTGFCKYLGKEGKCVVDETEKGWYIQYIERDPQVLLKQQQREERQQSDLNEEEITKRMIEAQIQAAFAKKAQEGDSEEDSMEEEMEDDPTARGEIRLDTTKLAVVSTQNSRKRVIAEAFNVDDEDDDEGEGVEETAGAHAIHKPSFLPGQKAGSSLEKLRLEEEQRKKARYSRDANSSSNTSDPATTSSHPSNSRTDHHDTWLSRDLVVKVIDRDSKYYKSKGVITDFWSKSNHSRRDYDVEIELLEEPKRRVFSLDHLENVIPKEGDLGIFIKGSERHRKARVLALDPQSYTCEVEFLDDHSRRKDIDYELLCKVSEQRR